MVFEQDDLVGVEGTAFTLVAGVATDASATFAGCLPFFVFAGVSSLIGVAGTTGTAGTIVDDVVRDIGRELGREPGRETPSPAIARGMAGAVKPGGTEGVDRRGCSKNWPVSGVPSAGRMES